MRGRKAAKILLVTRKPSFLYVVFRNFFCFGLVLFAFFAALWAAGGIDLSNYGSPFAKVENFKGWQREKTVPTLRQTIKMEKSEVVQVQSNVDGIFYFIAVDSPDMQKGADTFAEMQRRAKVLLQAIATKSSGNRKVIASDGTDITEDMKRLLVAHYGKNLSLAEYHEPGESVVGSNTGKGKLFEICLRSKKNPEEWNNLNTMFRVLVHEMAHSADSQQREDGEKGHGEVFKRLNMHLLAEAEVLGLYDCEEYKRTNQAFCGETLSEKYCGG